MIDLILDDTYRNASPDALAAVTNGCGPGAWKINLIPSHLRAVFDPACNYHDWLYHLGGTEEDRERADDLLQINCDICAINHTKDVIERKVLRRAAEIMHDAVRVGGRKYFGDAA